MILVVVDDLACVTPDGVVRYWVSESDPVVVQTRQELPNQPGVVFEQVLVAAQ